MTGNTASTPLHTGPIRKLRNTHWQDSRVSVKSPIRKSYQGRAVGRMRTRENDSTMKRQRPKTTTLRMNADPAFQWTGRSAKAVTSHTVDVRDPLTHNGRR